MSDTTLWVLFGLNALAMAGLLALAVHGVRRSRLEDERLEILWPEAPALAADDLRDGDVAADLAGHVAADAAADVADDVTAAAAAEAAADVAPAVVQLPEPRAETPEVVVLPEPSSPEVTSAR
jgi:hypothetical protein